MPKYPNLQRALLFKVLPESAQQQILNQPDISAACYELQLQFELHSTVAEEYYRRRKAGEDIDAMSEIGLPGQCPDDVTEEQCAQLVELDPANYHPSSTKLTPTARIRWYALLKQGMGEEYQDYLNSLGCTTEESSSAGLTPGD